MSTTNNNRDIALDIFKGILAIGMVIAHIVQFFPLKKVFLPFAQYANLTTYSGFMFAFGYVCYKAYFSKDLPFGVMAKKMGKGFIRILVAFYISGLAYLTLILWDFSPRAILDVLMLKFIPGYSEFLLSFAFLFIVMLLIGRLIKHINGPALTVVVVLSLTTTFIDYSFVKLPILGVFVGTTSYNCLPIMQYISYFVVGAYLARREQVFNWLIMIGAVAGTGAFGIWLAIHRALPDRFPPSLCWVVGGYLFVYGYYLIAKKLPYNRITGWVASVGQHTLSYLVISNVVIFFTRRVQAILDINLESAIVLPVYVVLAWLCFWVTKIYISLFKKRK